MAVAQFTFVSLPNPTEAALKWVETARKGSKAWTDGWLQIIATFSEVAQTQARTWKSLSPPMVAPLVAAMEALPAPVETPLAPIVEAMIETPPAPIAKAIVETAPAPAAEVETPAPALVAKATVEPIAPAPAAKTKVEPALAAATPPVAKVRVEPLSTPAPAVKAKAAPAAKPVAKVAEPAPEKKP
jgi:hypothetical protein